MSNNCKFAPKSQHVYDPSYILGYFLLFLCSLEGFLDFFDFLDFFFLCFFLVSPSESLVSDDVEELVVLEVLDDLKKGIF